ncbi:MAG TPA: FIST N-terminal domain-containing protein [Chthonomonadaceae bacterium]|nr:FIST N-terminal domain-containing protein [Chthonomonadaceae bacterium]
MRFAAAVSRREDVGEAVQHLAASVQHQLPGDVDLLAVFFTQHYLDEAAALAAKLRRELAPRALIGCSCEGVIGGDKEIEGEPGISVLAGQLPGITLTPFHISNEEWEDLLFSPESEDLLRRRVGLRGTRLESTRACLVFGDPFTTREEFLQALEALLPGVPLVGGIASGGHQFGQNRLLLNDGVVEDGVVGLRMAGPIRVATVVNQGCRPIGSSLLVTRAEENLIRTLNGRPAQEVIRETLEALAPEEQELVHNGLFIGIVINEYQPAFECGDFRLSATTF